MAVYISAAVAATAVSSFVFYLVCKQRHNLKKPLLIIVSFLNAVFCAIVPLLFALFSGETGAGAPARGTVVTFAVIFVCILIYTAVVIWRVVLRWPGVTLDLPAPAPDADIFTQNGKSAEFHPDFEKKPVDSVSNIDKMGITTQIRQDIDVNDIYDLINSAFDSLNGGNLVEAAEYFYSAIETHPPFNLEIQIVIQLSMIYCEIGHADLSYALLNDYKRQYRNRLSGEDAAALDAAVGRIESVVAGIGGNGYEED